MGGDSIVKIDGVLDAIKKGGLIPYSKSIYRKKLSEELLQYTLPAQLENMLVQLLVFGELKIWV